MTVQEEIDSAFVEAANQIKVKVSSNEIRTIVRLTQSQYDALSTPRSNTVLYVIVG